MATYVLIHGAYQGGWIWKPVAARLRAAGHLVFTPTLDGCGERAHLVRPGITVGTHAREIAQLLFYEDLSDVILAGTSAGGMVIQKAADAARERVARLAFVDALVLMPGEKVDDIVKRPAPNDTNELTTGPTKADAESRLFRDLEPALLASGAVRVREAGGEGAPGAGGRVGARRVGRAESRGGGALPQIAGAAFGPQALPPRQRAAFERRRRGEPIGESVVETRADER